MIFNKITIKVLYSMVSIITSFIQTISKVNAICVIKPVIKIPMDQNLPSYILKHGIIYSYVNTNSFLRVLNKIQKPAVLMIQAKIGDRSLGIPIVYINLSHTRS